MGSESPMANSPKICANKDCGMQLQPGDQYCASCGTKVPEPHALDRKYLIAAGLGLLIIGIVAGAYLPSSVIPGQSESEDLLYAYNLKTEGINELASKNFNNALIKFDEATKRNPYLEDVWYSMGDIALSPFKNYSDSLMYYRNATVADRDFCKAHIGMGRASFEMAYRDQSFKDFNNSSKHLEDAISAGYATYALNLKTNNAINWTKNIETNTTLNTILLKEALARNNASIAIDPIEQQSWETRRDLFMALSSQSVDNSKAKIYENEYKNCEYILDRLKDRESPNILVNIV